MVLLHDDVTTLQGRVLVADGEYAELSLRLRMHGTARGDSDHVSLARFATQLARALGDEGRPPKHLDVQAEIWPPPTPRDEHAVSDVPGAMTLRVRCDPPGLDQADVARITARAAHEWPAWATMKQTIDADLIAPPQAATLDAATATRTVPPKPASVAPGPAPAPSVSDNGKHPAAAAPPSVVPSPPARAAVAPSPTPAGAPASVSPPPESNGAAAVSPSQADAKQPPPANRSRLLIGVAAALVLVGSAIGIVVATSQPTGRTDDVDTAGATAAQAPTAAPTLAPQAAPTLVPTVAPAAEPTAAPTAEPTVAPTAVPTLVPTAAPTLAPTAAPTVVPTSAPTAVPTPAPTTLPATRAVANQGFVAGGPLPGWPNDPNSTAWSTPEGYRLFARRATQFVAIGNPTAERLRDVVVSARFVKVGGPPGGGFGIIIRDQGPGARDGTNQDGRFYVLEVGDKGEVGIWRRADNQWIDLVTWTASSAVRPGTAENELTVRAIGPRFTLLVNGVEAATAEDATLTEGATGIFVGGDQNQVVLRELRVESLN